MDQEQQQQNNEGDGVNFGGNNQDEEGKEDEAPNDSTTTTQQDESAEDLIARLNQEGVTLMQQQLFSRAAVTFARGLQFALREQAAVERTQDNNDNNNNNNNNNQPGDRNGSGRTSVQVIFSAEITVESSSSSSSSSSSASSPIEVAQVHHDNEAPSFGQNLDNNQAFPVSQASLEQPPQPQPHQQQQQQQQQQSLEDADGDDHWTSTFRIYNKAASISFSSLEQTRRLNNPEDAPVVDTADTVREGDVDSAAPGVEHAVEQEETQQQQTNERTVVQDEPQAGQEQQQENNNGSELALMCAVLTYNAGLVRHMKGFAEETSRRADPNTSADLQAELYRKSLQFYQVGVNMLQHFFQRHHVEPDVPPAQEDRNQRGHFHRVYFRRSRLLYMALINNMAQIHLHFSNRQAHIECCNVLQATLATRQHEEPTPNRQPGGDPQDDASDLRFFALNLIASQNLERQAAATA